MNRWHSATEAEEVTGSARPAERRVSLPRRRRRWMGHSRATRSGPCCEDYLNEGDLAVASGCSCVLGRTHTAGLW